jgi:hypothetical protein
MFKRDDVRDLTRGEGMQVERTNLEKSNEHDQRRRMEKYEHKYSVTSTDTGSGSMLRLRGNDKAEAMVLRDKRRFSFLPDKAKATQPDKPSLLQPESFQDASDDYMVALALQAELDREMADALNAEFVAGALDAACIQSFEYELEEAESAQDPTHPLESQTTELNKNEAVPNLGHVSQDDDDETLLPTGEAQLKMTTAGPMPNLGDQGNYSAARASGGLITPEEVLYSALAGDHLSESATGPKPKPDQFG